MSKPRDIPASLDAETSSDLARLAEHFGCSPEHLVTTAVMRFVNEEAIDPSNEFDKLPPYVDPDPLARELGRAEGRAMEALQAYLQPALDDIEAGRTFSHEEVMRRMKERLSSRDAA